MSERIDLIPAALYARVSSDRHDVDLSVAAHMRASRDYADKSGVWTILERRLFVRQVWGKVRMSARMFILKEYRHAKALDSL